MTPDPAPRRPPDKLPDWFPAWASQLADLYFSGTTAAFVLHGNTYDLFRIGAGEGSRYGVLAEFLAEQLFGRWSLVLHYDLGRGLRAFAGRDEQRLKDMVALANKELGDLSALPKDPAATFAVLDRFVRNNIMAAEDDRLSLAVIMDQASYVFPSGEPGRLNLQASSQLVTMLNWAMSPHVKRLNMAFVLIDEKLSDVSDRLTGNPHVATIEVPLPDETEREAFIRRRPGTRRSRTSRTSTRPSSAKLTAGISLTDLNVLIQSARESGKRLDANAFRALKKRLLERQCRGLLEFIEPRWTLDTVVGHEAAKARLREDAALLKRGALDSLPMGYLLCGPVGTGKSFLAQCVSGEIGVPCVILKNFRSKYVGETEGNLERVLSVLRAMGPVVVVVDEADAALGSREQEGDSGHVEPRVRHDRGADGRHAVSRPHHLDAAHRASGSAADRSQAPGAGRGAHPAVLSDGRERDPPDVRDPGEEARIARGGRGRAADSAARAAVGRRHRRHGGARLAVLAPRRRRSRDARGAGRASSRSSCRRRRGSSASCRKRRRCSNAPTGSFCRRPSSRRWRPRAGAASCRRG